VYSHVVMFYVEGPEDTAFVAEQLRSLSVPSLRGLEVGVDDSPSDRSAQICLITRFDDRAGYLEYADHPDHLKVVHAIKGKLRGAVKVDWG